MDHEICSVLPDWSGRCRRPGQLFYQLYLLAGIAGGVCPAVHGVTAFIVYNGVQDGIERVSRYMMPVLLVLVVVIAGYS